MSEQIPNQFYDKYQSKGPKNAPLAERLREAFGLLNATFAEWPLQWVRRGKGNKMQIDPQAGRLMLPVKLTAGRGSGSYYTGDVYADGTTTDATAEDQLIWMHGFDVLVGGSQPQRFYEAARIVVDISGTDTVVYEVQPAWPLPPSEAGVWLPVIEDSVWRYMQAKDCAENTVTDIDAGSGGA